MRRQLVAVLLVAPFVGVSVLFGHIADRQADDVALALSQVSAALDRMEPEVELADQEQVARWRAELALVLDDSDTALESGGGGAMTRRPHRAAPMPQGVFVSADKVLRLSRSGARPAGIPVNAAGTRPAGLLLTGVGGLGVGLRDGDILTHALGQPAVSEEAVVGAIIQARGARQPQLSGRVWRDGRTFALVVAQPYLDSG